MENVTGSAMTRGGRAVTIRRVVAPDADWADRVIPFLAHKGQPWIWQLQQLLKSKFGELTVRCYLADLATHGQPPEIVGNVCTIESLDVGLFGHVFTAPAHRGQGVARVLTEACLEDFKSRRGLALWLATGYGSTAYHIYQQFGFESVTAKDGIMVWLAPDGREQLDLRFRAAQPTDIRPMDWPDYATLNALACSPTGPPQRSWALRVIGQNIVEETFLALQRRMAQGSDIQAQVLAAGGDWPVGWAILAPDFGRFAPDQEPRPPMILDLHVHPNYLADYERLLGAIRWPAGRKVVALADSSCPVRLSVLEKTGFVQEGRLTRLFVWQGQPVDRLYLARNP